MGRAFVHLFTFSVYLLDLPSLSSLGLDVLSGISARA